MPFFLDKGHRVVAHDRRGHGRSAQTATGNEMDTYAADVIELAAALDLGDAVHMGHSTGGGALRRTELGTLTRFGCHIGHVYTAQVSCPRASGTGRGAS